jgi:hypothetical protein
MTKIKNTPVVILSDDGMYFDGIELRHLPHKKLPYYLNLIMNRARKIPGLEKVKIHYISNKGIKRSCPHISHIGQMGHAYTKILEISVVESDEGNEASGKTLIHELAHILTPDAGHGPKFIKAEQELIIKLQKKRW